MTRGFDRERFNALRKSKSAVGDIARVAGVHATTIYYWEKGVVTPQVDKLAAVMEVLGAPIEYVVRVPRDERYPGDWRVLLGVTQPRLAALAGIPTTTLRMIERGEVKLSHEKAVALSRLVNASTEEYVAAWQRARTRPAGEPA
ncbi:MAG: helix-turn-helix transcriptional regulator [Mycobacterium sp.]